MKKSVLLIATMDTKGQEAYYVRDQLASYGLNPLLMNTGAFLPFDGKVDISADDVVMASIGITTKEMFKTMNKGQCIDAIIRGAEILTKKLYDEGKFDAILSIGGAQGTIVGTAAMRTLPFGVPKFMVTTVASGTATFGPYVGTKDIIMMHSVCDILGLNFVTKTVFDTAVSGIYGMLNRKESGEKKETKGAIAVSMLGTTTTGALRAKELIEKAGYEFVAYHQNGTGGIAMEEMIADGFFVGVLDLNLHEIGDGYYGGLHGSIREGRLEEASRIELPQVIAPGSINYTVQGPENELSDELKKRKYIVHNPILTLVRLTIEEMIAVGKITAAKINKAKKYVSVMVPLKGFSFPDTEGREHWDPVGNEAFIKSLRENLDKRIEYKEYNLHINDTEFIDIAVNRLFTLIEEKEKAV
ncbi:MAG: Tm-1-like ATP-binding domain-containing protein [Sphaerochaetaceae bacterium]